MNNLNSFKYDEIKKEDLIKQEVVLKNRRDLLVTGVNKLESLNPNEFVFYTDYGKMMVKGQELEMKNLDIDHGRLSIIGKIDSIEYLDKVEVKVKQKGFITKLFK